MRAPLSWELSSIPARTECLTSQLIFPLHEQEWEKRLLPQSFMKRVSYYDKLVPRVMYSYPFFCTHIWLIMFLFVPEKQSGWLWFFRLEWSGHPDGKAVLPQVSRAWRDHQQPPQGNQGQGGHRRSQLHSVRARLTRKVSKANDVHLPI